MVTKNMAENKFNLSEKRDYRYDIRKWVYPEEKVKEFIRQCEERAVDLGDEPVVRLSDIKELAGDKLVNKNKDWDITW